MPDDFPAGSRVPFDTDLDAIGPEVTTEEAIAWADQATAREMRAKMEAAAPQTGQIVMVCCNEDCREPFSDGLRGWNGEINGCPRCDSDGKPHIAHSLDPKALAETHRVARAAFMAAVADPGCLDPLAPMFAAIGLTPPEPKEGGA